MSWCAVLNPPKSIELIAVNLAEFREDPFVDHAQVGSTIQVILVKQWADKIAIPAYSDPQRHFLLTNTCVKVECWGWFSGAYCRMLWLFNFPFMKKAASSPITIFPKKRSGLWRSHSTNCLRRGKSVSRSWCLACIL